MVRTIRFLLLAVTTLAALPASRAQDVLRAPQPEPLLAVNDGAHTVRLLQAQVDTVVMGGLAIARVPYGTYLRWVWPLLAMLATLCVVVLAVGAAVS